MSAQTDTRVQKVAAELVSILDEIEAYQEDPTNVLFLFGEALDNEFTLIFARGDRAKGLLEEGQKVLHVEVEPS